jgi:hypothetical protein
MLQTFYIPYRLIGFCPALVTGVGGDAHHWLDLGGACHDPSHRHQLPNVVRLHVADGQGARPSLLLEVDFTVIKEQTSGITHNKKMNVLCIIVKPLSKHQSQKMAITVKHALRDQEKEKAVIYWR